MYGRIRLRQAAGRRTSRDRTLLGTERGVAMPTTTSIEAPDANPGAPGRWASPAWMCRAAGAAALFGGMANGIRCHAESPDSRRGLLLGRHGAPFQIEAPDANPGAPGRWASPAWMCRAAGAAALFGGMANGIRCHAESPDSRRGLLLGRHGAPFQIEAPDANPGAPGRWASPAWMCRRKVAPVSDRWAVS